MAESSVTGDSDVIVPYNFEPNGLWSTSEDSDSTARQVSLNGSWCLCGKCLVMPTAIECTCCQELQELEECFEESGACVTNLEVFKIVCLDKDVLYTALVTVHTVQGDEVKKPISGK